MKPQIRIKPHIFGLAVAAAAVLLPCGDAVSQSYGGRDTDFRITLGYRSDPAGVEANIITTSSYPCEGYTIRSQVTWYRDTVNLRIVNFVRPSPCMQSMSEAQGTAFLGNLRDTTYVVRVYYREDVDLHRVKFSGGRILVRPIRNDFTRLSGY